jgi:hypothetical protein
MDLAAMRFTGYEDAGQLFIIDTPATMPERVAHGQPEVETCANS